MLTYAGAGYRLHYSSDLSGEVIIQNDATGERIEIAGSFLAAFLIHREHLELVTRAEESVHFGRDPVRQPAWFCPCGFCVEDQLRHCGTGRDFDRP